MSWKTVTVLVILVAGLGGFFYYDTYWLEPVREKKESVKGRLWDVEPKDVEVLIIKRKGETVRIRRTDTGWELLEPVKTRADRGAVDGIVSTLVTAREGESRGAVLHRLGHPPHCRDDDRDAVPVSFVDRDGHVLVPNRGQDEEIHPGKHAVDRARLEGTGEADGQGGGNTGESVLVELAVLILEGAVGGPVECQNRSSREQGYDRCQQ